MFSLIITVVAIALVAVLALATLYYGGQAFGKGAARAEASKLVMQGQQLLGAADLYYTANRRWPASINDLVQGNYLKQIPNAQASGLNEAIAAGQTWAMVPNVPSFYIQTGAIDVCAEVNLSASLRKRGVLRQAYTNLVAQCYGDSTLTTVFRKASTDAFPPGSDVSTDPNPPTDPTDPDWTMPPDGTTPPDDPDTDPPGGGTGGTSGPGPSTRFGNLEVSYLNFNFTVPTGDYFADGPMLGLRNAGNAGPVNLGTFTIADADDEWYVDTWDCEQWNADYSARIGKILQPGDSCEIYWEFNRMYVPATDVNTIGITFDQGSGTQSTTVTLTANVVPATPEFVLSPSDVEILFSADEVGQAKTATVEVTNNRATAVTGITVQATGTGFTQTNDCATATLQRWDSCTVTVSFTPGAAQDHSGSLTVSATGATTRTATLTGKLTVPLVTQLFLTRTGTSGNQNLFVTMYDGTANGNDVAQLMNGSSLVNYNLIWYGDDNAPANNNGRGDFVQAYTPGHTSGSTIQTYFPCGPSSSWGTCPTTSRLNVDTINFQIGMPYDGMIRHAYLPPSTNASSGAWCVTWTGDVNGTMNSTAVRGICPGFQGGTLMAFPSEVYFDELAAGQTATSSIAILNAGAPVSGLSATETLSGFSASMSGCGTSLASGQACEVPVTFSPHYAGGNFDQTLNISGTVNGGPVALDIGLYGTSSGSAGSSSYMAEGCPGGQKIHLHGGYQPNRLGIDQWTDPAGMYHGEWHNLYAYTCGP